MTIEVIFNKQTINGFNFDSAKGASRASLSGAFTLTAGQYYEIGWDGKTYTRKAYTLNGDSTVYIGNELRQKGEIDDITEPFIVAYVPGTSQNLFYAYDTSSSHIVGISTAEEPNSVLVKDWHGKEHQFMGYDTVYIRNAGGDAQPYTHGLLGSNIETPADFSGGDMVLTAEDGDFVKNVTVTKPETLISGNIVEGVDVAGIVGSLSIPTILEDLPIELDFSGGNQSIAAPDGYAVKTATIQQPENLTPANIAEGVDIAGIIGTLAAGGGAKTAIGKLSYKGAVQTITHNLGVIPDLVIVFDTSTATTPAKTGSIRMLVGCSAALGNALGITTLGIRYMHSSGTYHYYFASGTSLDNATGSGMLHNVTTTTFNVPSSLNTATAYAWIAIGGLTDS